MGSDKSWILVNWTCAALCSVIRVLLPSPSLSFFFFNRVQSCSLEICLSALRGEGNRLRNAHYRIRAGTIVFCCFCCCSQKVLMQRGRATCKSFVVRRNNIACGFQSDHRWTTVCVWFFFFISLFHFVFFPSSDSMFWLWAARCSTPCFTVNWLRTRMKSTFQMWNRQHFWQCWSKDSPLCELCELFLPQA